MEGYGPHRKRVTGAPYVSEVHLRVSVEDAENWWKPLEKVAIIVTVDLLYTIMFLKKG